MKAVVIHDSGIAGRAIAQGFQEADAAAAILGRNQEKLEKAEANPLSRDLLARAVSVDVTDRGHFQEIRLRIEQEFGSVDMIVNSQRIADIRTTVEVTGAVIATNLTSVFTACGFSGPAMINRDAMPGI